ncbi:hypothetical protein INR75_03245 [Zunongwangia sp. SCSIO 43204]|uniref:hypothetical protein n=1 Tax=Zunongwangia sp. SCSIO 43204 TaxID=2779359 RepID=UPI001CA9BBFD|nr:hypothetical protein [Zunongwangia sp. SCSIO 43204]UAB85058.1 hypothetical protein INR75_03245 [Zunongwangia sp. SCSIO 43204]
MIAYYAHSEGSGHARYASIFYKLLKGRLKIFSSTPAYFSPDTRIFKLAKEDPDGTGLPMDDTDAPDYLHYSPVAQRSIQRRSLQLLTGLVNAQCNLLFVDVSVEIAALSRVSSIPYAYIKLPGLRNDQPHIQSFKGSLFNLAFYPEAFEHPSTPNWVKEKTLYLGYFSRLHFVSNENTIALERIQKILILRGKGNGTKLVKALPKIAMRFQGLQIKALGDFSDLEQQVTGIQFLGFQSKISSYIDDADLIISSAGLNLSSEVLCSKKIFCCIPEDRPFMEQEHTASVLYENRLAFDLSEILLLSNEELMSRRKLYNSEFSKRRLECFVQWLDLYSSDIKMMAKKLPDLRNELDNTLLSFETIS